MEILRNEHSRAGPQVGRFVAVESSVCEYVQLLRRQGLPVTRHVLKLKALDIAEELKVSGFKASFGCIRRMMRRNGFALK